MKKFFSEFKTFITRGNVLDMAVGVIVGGAFTAIVNGLSNYILKPIINWILALILGKGSLNEVYTFLGEPAYTTDATGARVIDLANSFYIDWGSMINAVINFIIIAFVLFSIVKLMNGLRDGNDKLINAFKGKLTKDDKKELKLRKIKLSDKKAVEEYLAEKQAKEEEKLAVEKKAAEEKAIAERLANPTSEDLLKKIIEILEKREN